MAYRATFFFQASSTERSKIIAKINPTSQYLIVAESVVTQMAEIY